MVKVSCKDFLHCFHNLFYCHRKRTKSLYFNIIARLSVILTYFLCSVNSLLQKKSIMWFICLHLWVFLWPETHLLSPGGARPGARSRQRRPRPPTGLCSTTFVPSAYSRPTNICQQAAHSWFQLAQLRLPWTPPAQGLSGPPARRGRHPDPQQHGKRGLW